MQNFGLIVLVQSFFKEPRNAAIFSSFICVGTGFLNALVALDGTPAFAIRIACMFPTVTLIKTLRTLINLESSGIGVNFTNISQDFHYISVKSGLLYFVG